MSVADWDITPDYNVTVNGINIAEGCPAGNINGAIRAIMASVKVMYGDLPSAATLVPKTGAIFTDQPRVASRGAILHHSDPALGSGRIFIQVEGGSVPLGMTNGDLLIETAP